MKYRAELKDKSGAVLKVAEGPRIDSVLEEIERHLLHSGSHPDCEIIVREVK